MGGNGTAIGVFFLYKEMMIELNRCAMACEGCGAVFSLT